MYDLSLYKLIIIIFIFVHLVIKLFTTLTAIIFIDRIATRACNDISDLFLHQPIDTVSYARHEHLNTDFLMNCNEQRFQPSKPWTVPDFPSPFDLEPLRDFEEFGSPCVADFGWCDNTPFYKPETGASTSIDTEYYSQISCEFHENSDVSYHTPSSNRSTASNDLQNDVWKANEYGDVMNDLKNTYCYNPSAGSAFDRNVCSPLQESSDCSYLADSNCSNCSNFQLRPSKTSSQLFHSKDNVAETFKTQNCFNFCEDQTVTLPTSRAWSRSNLCVAKSDPWAREIESAAPEQFPSLTAIVKMQAESDYPQPNVIRIDTPQPNRNLAATTEFMSPCRLDSSKHCISTSWQKTAKTWWQNDVATPEMVDVAYISASHEQLTTLETRSSPYLVHSPEKIAGNQTVRLHHDSNYCLHGGDTKLCGKSQQEQAESPQTPGRDMRTSCRRRLFDDTICYDAQEEYAVRKTSHQQCKLFRHSKETSCAGHCKEDTATAQFRATLNRFDVSSDTYPFSAPANAATSGRVADRYRVRRKSSNVASVHRCDSCERVYTRMSTLRDHVRSQHSAGTRKFHICSICKRQFTQPSNLIAHQRTHTGIANYISVVVVIVVVV